MGRLASLALLLIFAERAAATEPRRLAADLGGEGRTVTVVAEARGGAVRIEVTDEGGRTVAETRAPAPTAGAPRLEIAAPSLGSAGALLEIVAATDASECRTIWRYRNGSLARLPIHDREGASLPDCEEPGRWRKRWEREAESRPAVYVRERDETTGRGVLRRKEVFAFAGFSLEYDKTRSAYEIAGIPIPSWSPAVLYTRPALETLYSRFALAALSREPALSIDAVPERGIFELRFTGPGERLVLPVEAYARTVGRTAKLSARQGERTARAIIRLGGDGSVPMEVRIEGLGVPFDQIYAPAGSWHGDEAPVFSTAADELAAEDLSGLWGDARGGRVTISIEGSPPFRLKVGSDTFSVDLDHPSSPDDLRLLPASGSGAGWSVSLRGPNAFLRTPLSCDPTASEPRCRPAGEPEMLRRLGALANAR